MIQIIKPEPRTIHDSSRRHGSSSSDQAGIDRLKLRYCCWREKSLPPFWGAVLSDEVSLRIQGSIKSGCSSFELPSRRLIDGFRSGYLNALYRTGLVHWKVNRPQSKCSGTLSMRSGESKGVWEGMRFCRKSQVCRLSRLDE